VQQLQFVVSWRWRRRRNRPAGRRRADVAARSRTQIDQATLVTDVLEQFHPFQALLFANDATLLQLVEENRFLLDLAFLVADLLELAIGVAALCVTATLARCASLA
jgi:hypothetical protein